jgi:hypothetical protein
MTPCTPRALSRFTDCFSSDAIEAAARRPGCVKRASQQTGTRFLALVTCGAWRDATTTLAPWAAQGTPWDEPVAGAPDAIQQRRNQRALAFLQALIHQARAQGQSIAKVGDAGLFPYFTQGYRAASTGFALPDSLHDLLPGSGGSAAQAGAKIHAGWDDTSSGLGHCGLPPWHMPDQKYVDQVIAFAPKGAWCIFALGYFKIQALARLALAGAYFLTRRKPQTTLCTLSTGGRRHVELLQRRQGGEGNRIERALVIGAKALVPARLVAVRMPEPSVNERRRGAQKQAQQKGSRPSQAPRNLWAWNLFISHGPAMLWKTTPRVKG